MTSVNILTLASIIILLVYLAAAAKYPDRRWDIAIRKHERHEKRNNFPGLEDNDNNECRGFIHKRDALTIRSKVIRKIGNGATPDICKQACLEATDFKCAAAQIQLPATCYIAGYQLRHDFFSTHYNRVCDHGPACFEEDEGMSGGFTDVETIPIYFQISEQIKALYCMARCERIEACVGFDMRRGSRTAQCAFLNMGIYTDYTFDLYLRRC